MDVIYITELIYHKDRDGSMMSDLCLIDLVNLVVYAHIFLYISFVYFCWGCINPLFSNGYIISQRCHAQLVVLSVDRYGHFFRVERRARSRIAWLSCFSNSISLKFFRQMHQARRTRIAMIQNNMTQSVIFQSVDSTF